MKIIVTGAAGFIGFHLCKRLLEEGIDVKGIDNFNSYYDPKLKESRYKKLIDLSEKLGSVFSIENAELENYDKIFHIISSFDATTIVNLAAQAGVRHSIDNPKSYINSNLLGFSNILEVSRNLNIKNLIYASSSSVYGGNTNIPFKEIDSVDHPVSLYAATKKSNEIMAHSYSHLYGIPSIGLRFFTVYGPWGRPDMALFKFTKAIIENKPIDVYNFGEMTRDFTYIDDVIESIFRLLSKPATADNKFDKAKPNPSTSWCPSRIFNVGNSNPTKLITFIEAIEQELKIKANKNLLPIQAGDVPITSADTNALQNWIGYKPKTTVKDGINKFIKWYLSFYIKPS